METQQFKGFWWFFGDKEEDTPGILEVFEDGSFKLTVYYGSHTRLEKKLSPIVMTRYSQKIEVILGIAKSAKNKDVLFSLFDCEFEHFMFAKIREVSFRGRVLVKHALIEDKRKVRLSAAFFKPQFIDTWVNEKSIRPDYDWSSKEYEINVHYKQPDPVTLYKDSNKHIYIYFRANFDGPPNQKFNLTQSVFINLEFKKVIGFEYLQNLVDQLRNWYSLAIGMPVSIDEYEARKSKSTEIDNEKYIELYIKDDRIFTSKNILHDGAELIPFQSELVKNGQALRNWFKNYELIEPSLRIYIDTLYNKHLYIQNQFLNYVFALEIYHKRKFNNTIPATKTINQNRFERVLDKVLKKDHEWLKSKLERQKEAINLETRLTELFSIYSYISKPLRINTASSLKKIVNTRHRLVHHSEKAKTNQLLEETALENTAQRLRIILQAIFLTEMGFDQVFIEKQIRRPFNNSYYFDMFKSRKV